MNVDMGTRLIGRQVAIEVATQEVNDSTTLGTSTYTRTGIYREIDSADNGDKIP